MSPPAGVELVKIRSGWSWMNVNRVTATTAPAVIHASLETVATRARHAPPGPGGSADAAGAASARPAGSVSVGRETVVYPFSVIGAGATIGTGCRIGPFARVGVDQVVVDGSAIGPAAHSEVAGS